MATFEETILSYLDGSLVSPEREDLLHAVSVSPEKRQLLDAHIRLRDILSVSYKPESAPLAVQRELAERIPALAAALPMVSNPIGAATTILGTTGSSAYAKWGAIAITVLLLAGGFWLFHPETRLSTKPQVTTPTNVLSGTSLQSDPPTSNHSSTFESPRLEQQFVHNETANAKTGVRSELPSHHTIRHSASNDVASSILSHAHNRNIATDIENTNNAGIAKTDNTVSGSRHTKNLTKSYSDTPSSNVLSADYSAIIGEPVLRSETVSPHRALPARLSAPEYNQFAKNDNWHWYVGLMSHNRVAPSTGSSPTANSGLPTVSNIVSTEDPTLGIEFALSPQILLEARSALTNAIYIESVHYSETLPDYPYLWHFVNEAAVATSRAISAEIGASYHIPSTTFGELSAQLLGGVVASHGLSPTAELSLESHQHVFGTELRIGLGADVMRVSPFAIPDRNYYINSIPEGTITRGAAVAPLTTFGVSLLIGVDIPIH